MSMSSFFRCEINGGVAQPCGIGVYADGRAFVLRGVSGSCARSRILTLAVLPGTGEDEEQYNKW